VKNVSKVQQVLRQVQFEIVGAFGKINIKNVKKINKKLVLIEKNETKNLNHLMRNNGVDLIAIQETQTSTDQNLHQLTKMPGF
jgi:hypothetical protein